MVRYNYSLTPIHHLDPSLTLWMVFGSFSYGHPLPYGSCDGLSLLNGSYDGLPLPYGSLASSPGSNAGAGEKREPGIYPLFAHASEIIL